MSARHATVAALLLLGIALVVLSPILSTTLLSDDFGLLGMLRQRIAEEGRLTFGMLFAERWHDTFSNYRPVLAVSIALDEAAYGTDPVGFHLTNLLLHVTTAFALAALALTIVVRRPDTSDHRARLAALLAGTFYLVHPFHSETLAWIAARGDLLATLGTVLGLLCFQRFRHRGCRGWLVASWLAFAAALLSKESALLTPLLPAGLDLWLRRWDGWRGFLRRARPHVALAAIIPLFLAARALVIGGLVGDYGGASPFAPARLREFWEYLPQTLVSLVLPINAATPRDFIPFARWTALILGLAFFLSGWPLRRRGLVGPLAWTASWWLITIGVFFPLFASGKGVTHYRLFSGPTAAGALLIASWWAAASATGAGRRRIATAVLLGWIAIHAVTTRLDLRAYSEASSIVSRVEADLERIRSEVARPQSTFVVLDTPTIVRSAPVFGAYLPMAFSRWLRDHPIALVPWLGAEPLPFLMMAASRPPRPGYVLRWDRDSRRLERVSAWLETVRPIDRTRPLTAALRVEGVWRAENVDVPSPEIGAVRIELASARLRRGRVRLRTSEDDRFNPIPVVPFTTSAKELMVVPAPLGEWLLAGALEAIEFEIEGEPTLDDIVRVELLGQAPEVAVSVLDRTHVQVTSEPATAHRLVIVLRRRREVRELPPNASARWTFELPRLEDYTPALDTIPEIPVLWYLEHLADDGRVVARSRLRALPLGAH